MQEESDVIVAPPDRTKCTPSHRTREEKAKGPSFHEVAETATDWMFDFTFTRLCCCFIDDRLEECQRSSKIMEVLLEDMPVIDSDKNKMVLIAQFLIRVLEGKHLDVQFEADEKLTPLDSAIMVFSLIEEEEENLRNLHEEINLFLKFQAVAVCIERRKFKLSLEVLDRQFTESDSNQYMRMKFSAIISRRDTYNEFLQNFSYEKMLQKIKNYINLTLNGKQPAFLLKEATKVVETKSKRGLETQREENRDPDLQTHESLKGQEDNYQSDYEEVNAQMKMLNTTDSDQNELQSSSNLQEDTADTDEYTESSCRPQRRLFNLVLHTPWRPDRQCTGKRLIGSISRVKTECENKENVKSLSRKKPSQPGALRKRKTWTETEDEQLMKGVELYGVGNWSKILSHYNFGSRTGVMLKDRWRTMKKLNIV